jgi:hypothetical protein
MEECFKKNLQEIISVIISPLCNRTLVELSLVILNSKSPTPKRGNGNNNETKIEGWENINEGDEFNDIGDKYGINGKVAAMSNINEHFEDVIMTKEEQHMVNQSLNYLRMDDVPFYLI